MSAGKHQEFVATEMMFAQIWEEVTAALLSTVLTAIKKIQTQIRYSKLIIE